MTCRHCGKSVSLLRRLSDAEFCSPEHRRLFTEMQQHLAFARLLEAQQKLSALPKTPLNPRTGEPVTAVPVETVPRLAPPLPFSLTSYAGTSLAANNPVPEWPDWKVTPPATHLALQGDWTASVIDCEPEQLEDPTAWAHLADLPMHQVTYSRGPEVSTQVLDWPAKPMPLFALLHALHPPAPILAGWVENRPNFLELCLSFLRVTGIPGPEFLRLRPQPLSAPPLLTRWPASPLSLQNVMPSLLLQLALHDLEEEASQPTAPDLAAAQPAAALPIACGPPRAAVSVQPEASPWVPAQDPLLVDFEQPAALPALGVNGIQPLWGRLADRSPAKAGGAAFSLQPLPALQDLAPAGPIPGAVATPDALDVHSGSRGQLPQHMAAHLPLAWQSGTAAWAAPAIQAAPLQRLPYAGPEAAALKPVGQLPHEPTTGEPACPVVSRKIANQPGSHRTALVPDALLPLFASSSTTFQQPKQNVVAAWLDGEKTLGTVTVHPPAPVQLESAGGVNLQPLSPQNWHSSASTSTLQQAALPAPLPSRRPLAPGWPHELVSGLLWAPMQPAPVRILARRSKV